MRDRTLAPCAVPCRVPNSLCEVGLNRTVQRRERTHCQALLSAPPSTSSPPPPLEGQANPLSSQGVGYTHAPHIQNSHQEEDETGRRDDDSLKSILVHYQHAGLKRFSRPPAEHPENQPERPDVYHLHSPQLVTSSPVCRIDQTKPNPSSPFHRWTTCPRSLRRELALTFSSEQTSPFRHRLTSSRPQNLPPSPQGRTLTRG